MKRSIKCLIYVLICIVICGSLSACSFGVVSNAPSEAVTELTEFTPSTESSSAKSDKETSDTTAKTESTTATAKAEKATEAQLEIKKVKDGRLTSQTEKNKTAAKKKSTTKKQKETTAAKKKAANSVSVTIECGDILKHRDLIQEGYLRYIPKNGILIKNYSVTYKNGLTVYSALKEACGKNGIPVGEKNTMTGKYINSINSLDENVLGTKNGGWTYYVNGEFPYKSVDNYSLSSGDKIEFRYVKVDDGKMPN